MSNFPKVTDKYFTERDGVLKVSISLNRLGLIFRETPNADIGIDGQIEFINDAKEATSRIIAVQIKAGSSFFDSKDKGDHWAFYAEEKHRNYWKAFPLPVMVMLHNPDKDLTYFADARYQLNLIDNYLSYIKIPKANILNSSSKENLFTSAGRLTGKLLSTEESVKLMLKTRNPNPTFSVSYLELFLFGLTNISRQLFFGMSVAMEIADLNNDTEFGIGLGYTDYQFLLDFVNFLVSENLASIDYADVIVNWKERELVPQFISPLTKRGRDLLDYIASIQKANEDTGITFPITSERLIRVEDFYGDARISGIRALETWLTKSR